MTTSSIYGGCYVEHCISPFHNQIGGSGLRACEVLSKLNSQIVHDFATTFYQEIEAPLLGIIDSMRNIRIDLKQSRFSKNNPPTFRYLNTLTPPNLAFEHDSNDVAPKISSDSALIFGTLETPPYIDAATVVYDPQSPDLPSHFFENGSKARRCALVLNHLEAVRLSGKSSIFDAVSFLRANFLQGTPAPYEVIIVKMAHAGCWVCTAELIETVPAFYTEKIFSIGSGDVFSAAFYSKWALDGRPPAEAADFASRFTANYCSSGVVTAIPADSLRPMPAVDPSAPLRKKKIYLAGPFFNQAEILFICQVKSVLTTPWTEVFSPLHEIGFGAANVVYNADIEGLESCDLVFAILNGLDPGTIFEIGYAVKAGKPVHCLAESVLHSHLTMIEGSGSAIETDFTSAVYKALWATLD